MAALPSLVVSSSARRRFLALSSAWLSGSGVGAAPGAAFTLWTFGDSILDCARYNDAGIQPGRLLVRNDDSRFPSFKGRDLLSRRSAVLEHRAVDGAVVSSLAAQTRGLPRTPGPSLALLTIGGNDLLGGLAADNAAGAGVRPFEAALERFLQQLPVRPVLLGNVYDPTFGNDARNFLGIDARVARAHHRRVNDAIAAAAERHGRLVDLHAHFLRGNPSWFIRTIERSLRGASEVRNAFLPAVLATA